MCVCYIQTNKQGKKKTYTLPPRLQPEGAFSSSALVELDNPQLRVGDGFQEAHPQCPYLGAELEGLVKGGKDKGLLSHPVPNLSLGDGGEGSWVIEGSSVERSSVIGKVEGVGEINEALRVAA